MQDFVSHLQDTTVYSISERLTKNRNRESAEVYPQEEKDLIKKAYDTESYKRS